jgi:hypothetical protein
MGELFIDRKTKGNYSRIYFVCPIEYTGEIIFNSLNLSDMVAVLAWNIANSGYVALFQFH